MADVRGIYAGLVLGRQGNLPSNTVGHTDFGLSLLRGRRHAVQVPLQKTRQHLEWLRETRRPCSTWSGSGRPEGPAALGVAQGDQKALQHLEWLRETRRPCSTWSGPGRPEGPAALGVAQGDQWLKETRRPFSTWSGSGRPEGPAALGVAQGDQWLRETRRPYSTCSGSGRPENPAACCCCTNSSGAFHIMMRPSSASLSTERVK